VPINASKMLGQEKLGQLRELRYHTIKNQPKKQLQFGIRPDLITFAKAVTSATFRCQGSS
jgi:hypothetical protein